MVTSECVSGVFVSGSKSKAISLSSFSTSAKLSGHVNIYYTTFSSLTLSLVPSSSLELL